MLNRAALLMLPMLIACGHGAGDGDLGAQDSSVPDLAAGADDLAIEHDLSNLEPPADLDAPADLAPPAPTEMFVSDWNNKAVYAFAIGARGTDAPSRTIVGSMTGFALPSYLAVHGNELFVVDEGNIRVFHTTDDGNIAPIRTLQVTSSPGLNVSEIRIDGTTLYVAVPMSFGPQMAASSIRAYAIDAQGTDAPLRTITGNATNVSNALALTVDSGYIYEAQSGTINVFLTGDNGNVAPQRTITSSANFFNGVSSLLVAGNELFAAVGESANFIYVYPTNASGDTVPSRIMTDIGSEWQLAYYASNLYLSDWYESKIEIFPASTNGSITTTASALTSTLSHPNGLVIH